MRTWDTQTNYFRHLKPLMELLAFLKLDVACKERHWIAFHLSFPLHSHTASRISFMKCKNDTLLPGSKDLNCLPFPRWKLRSSAHHARWSHLPSLPQIYILPSPIMSKSFPEDCPHGHGSKFLQNFHLATRARLHTSSSTPADSCPSCTGLPDSPACATGRDTILLNFPQNSELS